VDVLFALLPNHAAARTLTVQSPVVESIKRADSLQEIEQMCPRSRPPT
jgi:hypothetical protein